MTNQSMLHVVVQESQPHSLCERTQNMCVEHHVIIVHRGFQLRSFKNRPWVGGRRSHCALGFASHAPAISITILTEAMMPYKQAVVRSG